MHRKYDDEADAGEDKPVIVVNPANKEALGISEDGMANKTLMTVASIYDCCFVAVLFMIWMDIKPVALD